MASDPFGHERSHFWSRIQKLVTFHYISKDLNIGERTIVYLEVSPNAIPSEV